MKITISPSQDQSSQSHQHRTVSVEVPGDDLSVEQAVELVVTALVAYGYSASSVAEHIGPPVPLDLANE